MNIFKNLLLVVFGFMFGIFITSLDMVFVSRDLKSALDAVKLPFIWQPLVFSFAYLLVIGIVFLLLDRKEIRDENNINMELLLYIRKNLLRPINRRPYRNIRTRYNLRKMLKKASRKLYYV